LRNYIRDRIEGHIGVLDDIVGGDDVKRLRDANKFFGSASEIEGIAFDRVQRESANRFFSLGDKLLGNAGLVGGATYGAVSGNDPVESTLKAAAFGLGARMAGRFARQYGPQASAKALDVASRATGLSQAPGVASS